MPAEKRLCLLLFFLLMLVSVPWSMTTKTWTLAIRPMRAAKSAHPEPTRLMTRSASLRLVSTSRFNWICRPRALTWATVSTLRTSLIVSLRSKRRAISCGRIQKSSLPPHVSSAPNQRSAPPAVQRLQARRGVAIGRAARASPAAREGRVRRLGWRNLGTERGGRVDGIRA